MEKHDDREQPSAFGTSSFHRLARRSRILRHIECEALPPLKEAKHERERFSCRVITVKEDRAKYADLTSGPAIQLHEPEDVLKRWRATLEELKR